MKPPAFQFYAADFLVGTSTMTNEEVGISIRLLCYQWDKGFVPKDKASRIVGAEIPADVLSKFVETNGELRNQRLESVRSKQTEYREQQSLRGKAGAEAKWRSSRDGTRHPSANATEMPPPSSVDCPSDGSPPSVFGFQSSSQISASTSTNGVREAVEGLLSKTGYIKAGNIAQLAVDRRYMLEEVQQLVSYLEAHPEYGKGALEFRLKNSPPGTPIDKGWPEPRNRPQRKNAQRAGTEKLLAELSQDDIRKDLEWAVAMKMLQPRALHQFNDDPDDFLKFPANQSTLAQVIAARDAAIGQRAPTAQPPPADSSDRTENRTQRS